MRLLHRTTLALATAAAATVALALPAAAHVEPTTTEVPAGGAATVDFTVEHGCQGSPTVKVEFQVPAEITDAAPVTKAGWEGTVEGQVVTYAGGPLASDVEDTFAVTFTAPDTVGATLAFPFIQTCEEGSIEWIQTEEEAERPAPLVTIGQADPNATTTTAAEGTTTTAAAPTTEATTTTTAAVTTTTVAEDEEDGSASGGGSVAVIGVVLVSIVGIGVAAYLRRREA